MINMSNLTVEPAADIGKELKLIIKKLEFNHIESRRVICFRSKGSSSRATARIWSFPKIWQRALNLPAYYIIEVISEKYDRLDLKEQRKVLIHELLHIPKNFSGSLLPHKSRFARIDRKRIEAYYKKLV